MQAKGARIKHVTGDRYLVPSQSGTAGYLVDLAERTCTCEDAETCNGHCKHVFALLYATGALPMPAEDAVAKKRPTYKQDWPRYNAAQCEEKHRVQILLRGLCDGLVVPPTTPKRGGQPYPLSDVIYGAVMKVYTTVSGRRATTDIRACADAGYVEHAPSYNTLFRYVERASLKPLLTKLVEESAMPLKAIESAFAADATGFATSTYARWYDHKYGQEKKVQRWLKAHAMVGTATHVITAVEVTDGHENDSPHLKPLLATTQTRGWTMKEVSADKGYLSNENLMAVEDTGATVYIPFKVNSSPTGETEAWQRLFHLFSLHRREWLDRYHLRSNSETVFSSVKRKFGGSVRSKLPAAQENEVLLKLLCSNLSMLVHAIHELGIEPKFWLPAVKGEA